MKDTMAKMEMVQGGEVERPKMDRDIYIGHIVACVDVYLQDTKRQYRQRKTSATNPYTLETITDEVNELVRQNVIDRQLQTVPGTINPAITRSTSAGFKDGLLDHTARLNKARMGGSVHGRRGDPLDPDAIFGRNYTLVIIPEDLGLC
jgi:hypothetical protein